MSGQLATSPRTRRGRGVHHAPEYGHLLCVGMVPVVSATARAALADPPLTRDPDDDFVIFWLVKRTRSFREAATFWSGRASGLPSCLPPSSRTLNTGDSVLMSPALI